MPTKIENIYDAIVTICETQLSDYRRLPNPYQITENAFLKLQRGFAVAVGPGLDTERFIGCLMTWQRVFSVTIVRKVLTTENNLEIRENLEKDILVDHDLLTKAFYNDNTLSGNVLKSSITDDSGINFIDGDRLKFLAIELSLLVEYQQDPNS